MDDEPDTLALLRDVLERAGATVLAADRARGALEILREVVPDAMVSDLGMPDMDGFELIAEMRRSASTAARQIPAAALTAYRALGRSGQVAVQRIPDASVQADRSDRTAQCRPGADGVDLAGARPTLVASSLSRFVGSRAFFRSDVAADLRSASAQADLKVRDYATPNRKARQPVGAEGINWGYPQL